MDGAEFRKSLENQCSVCADEPPTIECLLMIAVSDVGWQCAIFSTRYDGSPDFSVLFVSIATLKLIFHLTGSQCSSWIVAENLIQPCRRGITLASVFWICSSLCMTLVRHKEALNWYNPYDSWPWNMRSSWWHLYWLLDGCGIECGCEQKHDLDIFYTWLLKDSVLSKVTPRILIWLERETGVPATLMLEVGRVLSHWAVPNNIMSVLSRLRARPLWQNRCRAQIQSSSRDRGALKLCLDIAIYSCVSSAYCCWSGPFIHIFVHVVKKVSDLK